MTNISYVLKTILLFNSFVETIFFQDSLMIEGSKEQHLYKND